MHMQRYVLTATASIIVLVLAACANPTATNAVRRLNRDAATAGSAHRYRITADGNGVEKYEVAPALSPSAAKNLQPTSADATLKNDILGKIGSVEATRGGSAAPRLLGVHAMGVSAVPGREIWFIERGTGAVRYDVTLTPSADGGTDFAVRGPL